ncbi:DNA alkylation repair protein [Sanguibacter suaedae]|uniref:DNA alkylation repair protein n=1 Tax=Sanguibacter suaedae TaxID=2795737 RepID=A0A934IDS3_9MICO|nr:DNA alkylation repair protein [Sanguibacter suaedae]MBI9115986.1 DNA alkylation repair protein [Sanguibacter suaedae]
MPFADELLGVEAVHGLVEVLEAASPGTRFEHVRATTGPLASLALRDRAHLVKDALLADVPGTVDDLGALLRRCLTDDRLTGWMVWPVTESVSARAIADGTDSALDTALDLQAALTGRLTAEFAVRPLLAHDLSRSLAAARRWADDGDEHVRRLASEGTRRHLPWGTKVPGLATDATVTLPILDALYRDESEYVRRSVANHLNDLSRADPDVTVATARRWLADPAPTTPALVRHALRTLVKRGHPDALALLGFAPAPHVSAELALGAAQVQVGESLGLTVTLRNDGPATTRVVLDYVVHHLRADGSRSPKVFKLTTRELAPGQTVHLDRTHSFKVITTRRYHPGTHTIGLQVNGRPTAGVDLELLPAPGAGAGAGEA